MTVDPGTRPPKQGVTGSAPLRREATVVLVLLALALRAASFTGPTQADDFAYLEHAKDWADGRFDPSRLDYIYGLRYGLVIPEAIAMSLLGASPLAVAIPPLIASLLGILAALSIGRSLGSPLTAWLAGLVVALTPVSVLSATMVLPEVYMDAALWWTVALTLRGMNERRMWLLFLGGLMGGYAYTIRSYGLVLAGLGFIPIGIMFRAGPRHLATFLVGLILLPSAEMLYHFVSTGDPLWSVHLQARVYADLGNLNNSLWFYPRELARPGWAFGLLPWLMLAAPLAWRGGRIGRLAVAWLLLWFGFLELAPMSLNPFVLIHKEIRYLSILVLPAGLVVGAGLEWGWRVGDRRGRALLLLLCALIAGVALVRVGQMSMFHRARMVKYRQVAQQLQRANADAVAFPHFRWAMRVNYLLGYQDGYRAFAPPRADARFRVPGPDDDPREGEWIVRDTRFFGPAGEWRMRHEPLPSWFEDTSSGWLALDVAPGLSLVRTPSSLPAADGTEASPRGRVPSRRDDGGRKGSPPMPPRPVPSVP